MSASETFKERLYEEFLPQFADHLSRGWGQGGFKDNSFLVTETDARNFLRALDTGLVRHVGRGMYSAAKSSAKEQLFWSGSKMVLPRPFTLWLEPIITIASLARLHFDYGWPADLLGTQSRKWEFDIVGYTNAAEDNEFLAGEIKKSVREATTLIEDILSLSGSGLVKVSGSAALRNSIKKYNGLVERRAKVFWVVGPNNFNRAFRVSELDEGKIAVVETNSDALAFPGHTAMPEEH